MVTKTHIYKITKGTEKWLINLYKLIILNFCGNFGSGIVCLLKIKTNKILKFILTNFFFLFVTFQQMYFLCSILY